MANPVSYQVVTCETQTGLEEKVLAALNNGWIPHGGVSVTQVAQQHSDGTWYEMLWAQAMVKPWIAPGW